MSVWLAASRSSEGRGDFLADVLGRFTRAFAKIARFVVIAKFDGFVFAGGSTGRNGRAAYSAVGEMHVRFNGGIAA